MTLNQYHCLIAGLPELSLQEPKEWITIPSFRELLLHELDPDDLVQVRLLFLREDHRNLIRFLETGEVDPDTPGNFSADDFLDQVERFSAIVPQPPLLPSYMVNALKTLTLSGEFTIPSDRIDPLQLSRTLEEGFYRHVMEQGCRFLKTYFRFLFNLENLLTFLETGRYGFDQQMFITGTSSLADHLRASAGRALTPDPEFEYFNEIMCSAEIPSLAEKEFRIDRLKWQFIEGTIFFEDFNINRIMGYLCQMMIISRWAGLDLQTGEARLREVIRGVRNQYVKEEG